MKRFFLLIAFSMLICCVYANHSYKGNDSDGPYNPDILIGDREYIHLIGGLYNKGAIKGVVYYVDSHSGYMKVTMATTKTRDFYVNYFDYIHKRGQNYTEHLDSYYTYSEALEAFNNSRFNMITLEEILIYDNNRNIINHNRTWKISPEHCMIPSFDPVWTSTKEADGSLYGYRSYFKDIIRADAGSDKVAFIYGSLDVPFEQEYISGYEKPDKNNGSDADYDCAVTSVRDICGNTYPVVKIGRQYWMAENMRCSRYDTESEAYNADYLTGNTLIRYDDYETASIPSYTDASDKSRWNIRKGTNIGYITDGDLSKFGYLYDWGASVGLSENDAYRTEQFQGERQGICPNGWHVPTIAEWNALKIQVELFDGNGFNTMGKVFKSRTGWFNAVYDFKRGVDSYGMSVLPANNEHEKPVDHIPYKGDCTFFWTATTDSRSGSDARYVKFYNNRDYVFFSDYSKGEMHAVRCVKD